MHAKLISLRHLLIPPSLYLPPSPPPSLFLSIYMHTITIPNCNTRPLQLFKMVPETDRQKRTCHRCISMHWSNKIMFTCYLAFGPLNFPKQKGQILLTVSDEGKGHIPSRTFCPPTLLLLMYTPASRKGKAILAARTIL